MLPRFAFAPQRNARSARLLWCECEMLAMQHNEMHDVRFYCRANVKCCNVSYRATTKCTIYVLLRCECKMLQRFALAPQRNARSALLLWCECEMLPRFAFGRSALLLCCACEVLPRFTFAPQRNARSAILLWCACEMLPGFAFAPQRNARSARLL